MYENANAGGGGLNPLPTQRGEGDLNTTERRTEQAQRRVQKNIKKDAKRTARELKKKEQLTRKSVCIDFPFPTGQMRCMKFLHLKYYLQQSSRAC